MYFICQQRACCYKMDVVLQNKTERVSESQKVDEAYYYYSSIVFQRKVK